MTPNAHFKAQLTARKPLVGCFIKTPHPIVVEVLGASSLDFLVLDAEHAPFDRASIDACMIAARAVNCPVLVRIPSPDPAGLLNVLDCGAAGVLVPHVNTVEQAEVLAQAMHYGPGGRGFAATTRAGGYGSRSLTDHKSRARDEVSLICQIEDQEGAENFEAIASVADVDALFVGRADLAVSYGLEDFNAPEVADLCGDILGAKHAATGLFCAPSEDTHKWRSKGASFVVSGSDHSFLTNGAAALCASFANN